MKKLLLIATLLAAPAFGQPQAPLPAQCRANYDLWSADKKAELARLTVAELDDRGLVMSNCASVVGHDKDRDDRDYMFSWALYRGLIAQRLGAYLHRHQQWTEFVKEDAAGEGR